MQSIGVIRLDNGVLVVARLFIESLGANWANGCTLQPAIAAPERVERISTLSDLALLPPSVFTSRR